MFGGAPPRPMLNSVVEFLLQLFTEPNAVAPDATGHLGNKSKA
jgi:hypothetical protein